MKESDERGNHRTRVRHLVERGYDVVAEAYLASKEEDDPFLLRVLRALANRLPPGVAVLDLGCGAGVPATRWLAQNGFVVTGVDLSALQLELARHNVPLGATFLKADMADEGSLTFPPASFAAALALYSIIHVPREEQSALLLRIRRWLCAGGLFLATWAVGEWEGEEADWEGWGAPMWWSHYDADANRALLADAGFVSLWEETVTSHGETWLWLLAQAE